MKFEAIEFETSDEALQHVAAGGRGVAILLHAKALVVSVEDADRLQAEGVEFAYLYDEECSDGRYRILTIPVN